MTKIIKLAIAAAICSVLVLASSAPACAQQPPVTCTAYAWENAGGGHAEMRIDKITPNRVQGYYRAIHPSGDILAQGPIDRPLDNGLFRFRTYYLGIWPEELRGSFTNNDNPVLAVPDIRFKCDGLTSRVRVSQ